MDHNTTVTIADADEALRILWAYLDGSMSMPSAEHALSKLARFVRQHDDTEQAQEPAVEPVPA